MSIKVLVVDDSAFMRRVISDMLNSSAGIEVVATARNGIEALEKMITYEPQVITLDVEMPKMDGITALKQIMRNRPTPVIMLSSVTQKGSKETMEALFLGALDFVPKPSGAISLDLEKVKNELVFKVRAAVKAQMPAQKVKQRVVLPEPPEKTKTINQTRVSNVLAIGSSTGGPKALESILTHLPGDLPASILITQHMPKGFTRSLAERLDRLCHLRVKEAEEGDIVRNGQVFIAPGGYHLKLKKREEMYLSEEDPVEHVRPSADVMMNSISKYYGKNTVGVILTGMGKDGTSGMEAIKKAGGRTIVQDKSTAAIFSMPGSVIKAGYADFVVPLKDMAVKIAGCIRNL